MVCWPDCTTRIVFISARRCRCGASTKGALNMSRLGFHAKELMGGLGWWKRDGYKTEVSSVKG